MKEALFRPSLNLSVNGIPSPDEKVIEGCFQKSDSSLVASEYVMGGNALDALRWRSLSHIEFGFH